jgi:arsenite-transporting ATPase
MRIIIVTGKGGVGKTSIAAATALRAARSGLRTLVMSTDSAHSLSDCFEVQLGPEPVAIEQGLYGQEVDARTELVKNWGHIRQFINTALQARGVDGIVAEELSVFPGMEELFSLFLVRKYFEQAAYDLVILDCAPTDSTIRLLSLPDVLNWYLKKIFPIQRTVARIARPIVKRTLDVNLPGEGVFEDIRGFVTALDGIRDILTDPGITTVRLVVNLEKMVIRETQRTYTCMNLFGYLVDAVFVNRILPEEMGAGYMEGWKAIQSGYMARVRESFAAARIFQSRLFEREMVGLERLQEFGEQLFGQVDPARVFSDSRPMTLARQEDGYRLTWRIPGVDRDGIDLWTKGDELILKTPSHMRNMVLPSVLVGRRITDALFQEGTLTITFGAGS